MKPKRRNQHSGLSFLLCPGILFLIMAAYPAAGRTARSVLPADGDYARLQPIEGFVPQDGATVWDFSSANNIRDAFDIRFSRASDSCLSVTMPGIRYDFAIAGDTVLRIATETHFIRVSDTIPLLYDMPLTAGDYSGCFASRGRAYHSEYIDATGVVSLSVVGRGTLILPLGDTISNVMLTRLQTRQLISSAMHRPSPVGDCDAATLLRRVTIVLTWKTGDYCVPLAQHTVTADSIGSVRCGENTVSAWICPPLYQPASIPDASPSERRYSPRGTDLPLGGTHLSDMSVTQSGNGISVSGTSPDDCRISMILSDALGRVFASMPATAYTRGAIVEWSCDGLPPGNYILYIGRDELPEQACKLTIK